MAAQTSILKHAFCFPFHNHLVFMRLEHFKLIYNYFLAKKIVISNMLKHIKRIIQSETTLEQMLDGLHLVTH